jgi:hypothetical protein
MGNDLARKQTNHFPYKYTDNLTLVIISTYTAYEDGTVCRVPDLQHIKPRCRGIAQKQAYNIQNMAKV